MFNIQKWRKQLYYAGFACLFVLIGMLFSTISINANQKFEQFFDLAPFGSRVKCSRVSVSNGSGEKRLNLVYNAYGGGLLVFSGRDAAKSFWKKRKSRDSLAYIGALEHGGRIWIWDEDMPDEPKKSNYLGIAEYGGIVKIIGHGSWDSKVAGINEYGDGFYRK